MSSPPPQPAPPFEDPPHSFRHPSKPLPPSVWLVFALLVSLLLFLVLRLVVLRWAAAVHEDAPVPSSATTSRILRPSQAGKPAATPPASPEHFRELIEGWRRAWVAQDLPRYLRYYSRNFGSRGLDLSEWAEHKSRAFAAREAIEVEVRAMHSTVRQSIAVVSFAQVYRSRGHEDRGVKILHLVPEDGEWRIFNEEWTPASGAEVER